MTVVSSALLCEVTVSPAQLASDELLELVLLHLVSPLQVRVVQSDGAKLAMTFSDQVLTQRNVILKTLVDFIGVKQNHTGRSLLAHPTAPVGSAALTAWMSIADSIRGDQAAADALLPQLDTHLWAYAFLLPHSHTASLADLDLAVALLRHRPEAAGGAHAHVARWLRTCHALLAGFGCGGLPALEAATPAYPVFFDGTEDASLIFPAEGAAAPPKGRPPQDKGQPQTNTAGDKKAKQSEPNAKGGPGAPPAKEKKKKAPKEPAAAAAPEAAPADFDVSALDIRVGRILKAWHHPEADKLFCEEIDLGNGEVREIASGLRPFYQTEDLTGRSVLVLCNLKKRNLVGFGSHGMVLCASNADHTQVKFVVPPPGASPGDRVTFGELKGEPEPESKVAKKKIFEKIAPDLKTNGEGQVVWKDSVAKVAGGDVTAELKDAQVS